MKWMGIGLAALLVVVAVLVIWKIPSRRDAGGASDAAPVPAQRGEEKNPEPAAITLTQLWDIQQKYFQQIKSFHFDMTMKTGTRPEGQQGEPVWERETRMSWTVDGEKYRIETEFLKQATATSQKAVYAFDGSHYQWLSGPRLYVEKSLDPNQVKYSPFLGSVPLFMPFGFAYRITTEKGVPTLRVNLEIFKSPETWAAVAKTAQGIQPTRMLDHDGVLVQFAEREQAGAKLSQQVFFAKDLGYFPIYTKSAGTTAGGQMTGHSRVTETKAIGSVLVPMRFEDTSKDSQGKESVTIMTVDPATAQVNQKIDPAVFATLVPQADIDSGKVKVVDTDALMKRRR